MTQLLQLCLSGLRLKTLSNFTSANVDKASSIRNLPGVLALHRPPVGLNQTFWYKLLTLEGDCTVAAMHEIHGSNLTTVDLHADLDLKLCEAPCSGRAHRTPVMAPLGDVLLATLQHVKLCDLQHVQLCDLRSMACQKQCLTSFALHVQCI